MKEHNTHHNNDLEVSENYKEEGPITVETLNVSSHNTTSELHKKHSRKSFTLSTPIAIIIGAVIIAFGLMGYGLITQNGGNSKPKTMFTGRPVDTTDFVDGKENSKVIVIEYSDTECPYCVQVSPTIKKLRTDYADKVAFTFRYFPLTQIHKNAFDESRAMACVGIVGGSKKFFEYHDAFFDYKMSKQTTTLTATGKEDLARTVGVDMTAFKNCMDTKQTEKVVSDSMNDGVTAGVQGTPSTFVLLKTRKGYEVVSMVDGARPYEFFKAVIDEALAR